MSWEKIIGWALAVLLVLAVIYFIFQLAESV